MGKEARAACRWGEESGMVTAVLEGDVLLVRGEIRATARRSTIHDVEIVGTDLRFLAGDVPVLLSLGSIAAKRWAASLVDGPPTLAKKLGVTETTRARIYGTIDDEAFAAALSIAAERISGDARSEAPATVVFVRADGARELDSALSAHLGSEDRDAPLWVVYRKGKDMPLNEAGVRAAVRARGLIDTKVAGISPLLSATRFSPRASAEGEAAAPTIGVTPVRRSHASRPNPLPPAPPPERIFSAPRGPKPPKPQPRPKR